MFRKNSKSVILSPKGEGSPENLSDGYPGVRLLNQDRVRVAAGRGALPAAWDQMHRGRSFDRYAVSG